MGFNFATLANKDPKIIVVTAVMTAGTGLIQ